MNSRSPHGERGLKSNLCEDLVELGIVALLTESVDWNDNLYRFVGVASCRSPHGERGLKSVGENMYQKLTSRSPHGERGLKYLNDWNINLTHCVALLTESVDWNILFAKLLHNRNWVALLTESVDWNDRVTKTEVERWIVALLTESVDWNDRVTKTEVERWIVALLTESVDWNGQAV